MKQLVILSGKGGTGKTSVAAALAHLASQEMPIVLADADVDAANLELVLEPTRVEEHVFMGGQVAVIEPDRCTLCGRCYEVCRFDAVVPGEDASVSRGPAGLRGLRLVRLPVPGGGHPQRGAAGRALVPLRYALWALFHAHLFAGQENSGKLVTMVKQQGRLWPWTRAGICSSWTGRRASAARSSRPAPGPTWPCW